MPDVPPSNPPVTAPGRNLVICCDGTSNQFGTRNTNVVRVVQSVVQDDSQLVYYDPGVGTLPASNRVSRLGKMWSKVTGLAFGAGLTTDVIEAYRFLMENWMPGDRVFIFGFSRGAYTARVLAGLCHLFGLLPKGGDNHLAYLIQYYQSLFNLPKEEFGKLMATYDQFRLTFARSIPGSPDQQRRFPVHFLGIWDTVSTVGWVWEPRNFVFTRNNPGVRFTRHAMALDERRVFFRQNRAGGNKDLLPEDTDQATGKPKIIQCWFAGSHCDVGGGHELPEDQLWPLTFDWMLEEAVEAGLTVDRSRQAALFRPVTSEIWTAKHHESLAGPWVFAERFPAIRWRQDEQKSWKRGFETGNGRSRRVLHGELLHRSLLQRLRAEQVALPSGTGRYEPRNLCVKYREEVARLSDPLPEYHTYTPAPGCDCEACKKVLR